MDIRKLLIRTLAVGAVLALARKLFAKTAKARPVRDNAPYDAIDAYVEQQARRLNIPGVSLAIVAGDQIVHLRGFGQARPGGEAPSPQTPFFIGSLTKSFTALAVMQLVEAGKVVLDAPVVRYLPWFRVADPQASARLAVRHLLNQTSGLPTSSGEIVLADFDNRPGATERQARALSTLVLTRPVGTAFEYSNMNYNLLGLIIEAASGEKYADYVQEHILTPLDMRHTYTSQALAKQNGLAVGHQYWFAIPCAAPNMPIPPGSLPSGGLSSSAEDMARYLIAHLNGGRCGDVQLLSQAGIDELHRGVADFSAMGLALGQYGMGWFVDKIGQTKIAWHGGTLPDFGAYVALLPGQKKGIVLLFNACQHWMTPVLAEFGAGVAALLAGDQPAPSRFADLIPWMLRGQLLIPALQIASVAATLRRLRRWRLDPQRRPSGGRQWGLHILLPLIPNVLAALTLIPMLGKRRGYLRLYMPDYFWLAMVCGSFALVWSFLRTGLVLRALRRPRRPKPSMDGSSASKSGEHLQISTS
jgi:CubicO group peptidase (beta-lactamase class C family)